jgi:NAD(P)-dependent dehydrogenase (short-subunit alcohol dehydrogenase family)
MRIILVGASGVVGGAVRAALGARHEIIAVSRSTGEVQVDIADPVSIREFFDRAGQFDALICTAGVVKYAPFTQLGETDYEVGLRSKLMGQVNLVTYGLPRIADGGSFTLTSGLTNDDPIREGAASSLVNGALEGYVHGAAIEMPRGVRINLVSPTLVEESTALYGPYFPGTTTMPARDVALGYVKSVEGAQSGRVFRMGWSTGAIG